MKTYILSALFCLVSSITIAQTQTDSVKSVVNRLFVAMKTADAKLLASCFADSSILQTVSVSKSGEVVLRNEGTSSFINFIANEKPGNADERNKIEVVKIDGNLASVWSVYTFYYKGNFSHCGANSFQLVKLNGEWKIQYLIDTRRKDCK
jgi:hypothetical protein